MSASCPESELTGALFYFPGQHHTFLPRLIDMFLATSGVPSLSVSRVHPSGLDQCRKFTLLLAPGHACCRMAAGYVAEGRSAPVPASVTSHQTGRNTSAGPFHTSPLEG